MLWIIHSIPEECAGCGSLNVKGLAGMMAGTINSGYCEDCGVSMLIQEEDDEKVLELDEVVASFLNCPHCCEVDQIEVAGGKEWCRSCGLDPNIEDYPIARLSHLYLDGSEIQGMMRRGLPKSVGTRLRTFLTTECGPHCSYGDMCPQETATLGHCFQEYRKDAQQELQIVGKNKKKKRRLTEKQRQLIGKKKAQVAFASDGWYVRKQNYRDETNNQEQHRDKGGRSGT